MANSEHLKVLKRGVEAWNGWREEHPAVQPDLSQAELSGADLSGANLYAADLRLADLVQAHLRWANLYAADLRLADLVQAHLRWANLTEADLTEADLTAVCLNAANLSMANLSRANLSKADLEGEQLYDVYDEYEGSRIIARCTSFSSTRVAEADFTEARLGYAVFADMDLSEARGLETVHHYGPSTIGIDTIFRSKGQIPEVFLRGAGVPEILITYLPSLLSQPIQYYSCFISYNHEDKVFARRIHDTLQGRGIRCWLDEHQLLPGDDIYEQVDRAIRLWDKVLLCCSESSLASWWVENEIETAFRKEQGLMKQRGKRVLALIPLNLDGYLFKWENGKAPQVLTRLAADFTGWEKDNSIFEKQVERVLKALQTGDTGREPPPTPRL